jgi:hypothetical protein
MRKTLETLLPGVLITYNNAVSKPVLFFTAKTGTGNEMGFNF